MAASTAITAMVITSSISVKPRRFAVWIQSPIVSLFPPSPSNAHPWRWAAGDCGVRSARLSLDFFTLCCTLLNKRTDLPRFVFLAATFHTVNTTAPLPDREQLLLLRPFERLALDRIALVATPRQAQDAAQALLQSAAWGFDTESKPTFLAG